MSESVATDLKVACAQIGRPVRIGAYEKLVKVAMSESAVSILVEYIQVDETVREFRIVGSGKRLMSWTRPVVESAPWDYAGMMQVPNPDHILVVHLKYGEPNTPQRIRERREYERNCYRPGNEVRPMDGYSRCLEGPSPMERHW